METDGVMVGDGLGEGEGAEGVWANRARMERLSNNRAKIILVRDIPFLIGENL